MELIIPRQLLRRLVNHCREERPLEACGMLAGGRNFALGGYAITNKARSTVRYYIDEEEQAMAFASMAEQGHDLVAIYHSHPTAAPVPSAADVRLAYYPEAFYLIVSLAQGQPQVRAYRIVDGQVRDAAIKLSDEGPGYWVDLRRY